MRVLVDATMLDGRPSGAATRLLGLGRAHAARGRVDVVYAVRPGVDPLPGLTCVDGPGLDTPARRARAARRVDELARRAGASLFHAGALPLPRGLCTPLFATVHDLRFLEPRAGASWARRAWGRVALRPNLEHARVVVAVSDTTGCALVERVGLDADRVVVVPNAPTPELAPAALDRVAALRRALDLNTRYVLAIAEMAPHKNLERLLDVLARARAEQPDLALLVVGRAPSSAALRFAERARALGVGDAVRVAGELGDAELSAALTGADALVVPSWTEGFSIPAVDAQRFGVPVVAADAGALPEVCGDTAWFAAPDDVEGLARAVRAATTASPEREVRVAAARSLAERWSWETSAARLEEAWDAGLSR